MMVTAMMVSALMHMKLNMVMTTATMMMNMITMISMLAAMVMTALMTATMVTALTGDDDKDQK